MIPNIIFFLAFFLAFSLIQFFFAYLLNRFASGHWTFFIDKIIRFTVHHRIGLKCFAYGSAAVFAIFLLYATSVHQIILKSTLELKWFALAMAAMMVFIYFFMIRRSSALAMMRRLQQYVYVIVSIFLFTLIIMLADQSYGQYQQFMNASVINPALRQVKQTLDQQEKASLLSKFREQVKSGECQNVDYRKNSQTDVVQFVFVAFEPALRAPDYTEGADISQEFSGKACTDGRNTFLLKRDGSWYWVISQ